MKKKTKTVRYEITYRSWTEHPPYTSKHTDKIVAMDDADAANTFCYLKTQYERCKDFKLIRITRETWTAKRSGLPEIVTVITKTQLA